MKVSMIFKLDIHVTSKLDFPMNSWHKRVYIRVSDFRNLNQQSLLDLIIQTPSIYFR